MALDWSNFVVVTDGTGVVKLHCGSVAQIWESISSREIGVFGMPTLVWFSMYDNRS